MTAAQEAVVATTPRVAWVDDLRVLVVAGVIVVHTATGYITGVADWYYDEIGTPTVWSTVLTFPAVAGGLFGLGPLFFLAGWLSPPSLARRGAGGFARSRLLRLGAPLAAFMLVVVVVNDVPNDARWPHFAPRTAVLGLRSQMGLRPSVRSSRGHQMGLTSRRRQAARHSWAGGPRLGSPSGVGPTGMCKTDRVRQRRGARQRGSGP